MIKYLSHKDLDGKETKYPVRVGYSALKEIKEKHGLSFDDFDKITGEPEALQTLLKQSIISGCRALRQEPPKLDDELLFEIMEECMFDFFKLIPEFFPNQEGAIPPAHVKTKTQKKK